MSGLVTGLQNRLRRFESARHLLKESVCSPFFIYEIKEQYMFELSVWLKQCQELQKTSAKKIEEDVKRVL